MQEISHRANLTVQETGRLLQKSGCARLPPPNGSVPKHTHTTWTLPGVDA